uniref:Uncharacterized protein n=1 Tax=Elaeophora elaphi TaxID=1147741 RepID=A0A0R3S5Y5_9BILA
MHRRGSDNSVRIESTTISGRFAPSLQHMRKFTRDKVNDNDKVNYR